MNAKQLAKRQARANMDRAGYPGPVKMAVKSTPWVDTDGTIITWAHNQNPGPLDGQPRCNHTASFTYADGTVVSIDAAGNRDKPWPGGTMSF